MLARRLICVLKPRKLSERPCIRDNARSHVHARAYGVDHEIKQHQWQEKEKDLTQVKMTDDPEKPKTFLWFPTHAPKQSDFSIGNIKNWYAHQKLVFTKQQQVFIPERHETLGADLATAHFIVFRGGKVRFRGNSQWIEYDEKVLLNLPGKFDPTYVLEAVDVNGFDLHYEGLSNFCSLTRLKWLSLKNCKNIDDWGLDKISAEFPKLEYLDISGCEKITERGLESLYRMPLLKTLIVTNYYKSVAFELTCMMLEDCTPGLTCEIRLPEERLEE